jgi:methylenetetrahydrofolate reductase (NADPH)
MTDPVEDAAARLARRPWPVARADIEVSFEYFPPSTPAGRETFLACTDRLAQLSPRYVSVTYGAGGTTQDRTLEAVRLLTARSDVPVAGHLTCVGATRDEVAEVIDAYLDTGVRHIVALRGDAPPGREDGAVPGGYADAFELVEGIRCHGEQAGIDIEISVGAYPEVHPKALSRQADLANLVRKFEAGADRAITQFFFDPDVYLRFLDDARSAGITAPIVPGIMPVTNFAGIVRFSERCGATVPEWMHELFAGLDDAPEIRQLVAATIAAEQCRRLAEHGVSEFHFYTMNKSELTEAICRILGVAPTVVAPAMVTDVSTGRRVGVT